MSHHFDPFDKAMEDAQKRIIAAGLAGGSNHEEVDIQTVIMGSMYWAVKHIEASNKALAEKIADKEEETMKDRIKRNGPAVSIGAVLVGALAFLKDWLGS